MSKEIGPKTRFIKFEVLIPESTFELTKNDYVEEYRTPKKMLYAELDGSLLNSNQGDIFIEPKGIVQHERFFGTKAEKKSKLKYLVDWTRTQCQKKK